MIYLDNNATTHPLPAVREKIIECLSVNWGNPSSAHVQGTAAKAAVDLARREVGDFVGVASEQVLFTSTATEANNTAILSALRAFPKRRRIITSATEHSAVLSTVRAQEARGYELTVVPVDQGGVVNLPALEAAISEDTAVVSVMWANNETGVINPVANLAALCRSRGVLFHCDAAQAAGRLSLGDAAQAVDFLSISAHKLHGPKGVGALIVGSDATVEPLLFGGPQEGGRRGGTENVPAIVGFGEAARWAAAGLLERNAKVAALRDQLESALLAKIHGTVVHGHGSQRLPNTTNVGFTGVEADTLVAVLDQQGVCVSAGSACLSDAVTPSHVIQAMTGSYQSASEAVRFSLSPFNTAAEIERAIDIVQQAVAQLR